MISCIFLMLTSVTMSSFSAIEDSAFYSTPASDIVLENVTVNKDALSNSFQKESSKKFVINLTNEYYDIYEKLPDYGKKIMVKLIF